MMGQKMTNEQKQQYLESLLVEDKAALLEETSKMSQDVLQLTAKFRQVRSVMVDAITQVKKIDSEMQALQNKRNQIESQLLSLQGRSDMLSELLIEKKENTPIGGEEVQETEVEESE